MIYSKHGILEATEVLKEALCPYFLKYFSFGSLIHKIIENCCCSSFLANVKSQEGYGKY